MTVIEVSGEELKLSERNVSIAEFARTNVNLAGKEDWQSMLESLRAALENARKAAISDHVICRLELVGSSILGWRLHRDADLLLVEAQDAADQIGQIWIDKIENKVKLRRSCQGSTVTFLKPRTSSKIGLVRAAMPSEPSKRSVETRRRHCSRKSAETS